MYSGGSTPQPPEGLSKREATITIQELDREHDQTTRKLPDPPAKSTTPRTTIATKSSPQAQHYIETAARVSAHATSDDQLNIIFQTENPANSFTQDDPPSAEALIPFMYAQNVWRLQAKLEAGGLIVEAADFAATASWMPASATPAPIPASALAEFASAGRPIFAKFLADIEAAKEKHMHPISRKYWTMSLMARDPRREYVPGAVRAVIEPFLKMAEEEGVPIWLEAGSARARDVYAHFGFEVVQVVTVGGTWIWCMIRR